MSTRRVRLHDVLFVAALCLGILLAGGCRGKGGPKTVSVTGTVTLKGQPIEGATVSFSPKSAGVRSAVAKTDARGRFQLMTIYPGDGAMPGSYAVIISKTEEGKIPDPLPDGLSFEEIVEHSKKAAAKHSASSGTSQASFAAKNLLPAKYADSATSNLAAEVKLQGVNRFAFELTE